MGLGLCTSAKKKHARKAPHRFLKTTNVKSALQQLEVEEKVLHQVLFIEDAVTESELTDRLAKAEKNKANRVGKRGNTASQQQGPGIIIAKRLFVCHDDEFLCGKLHIHIQLGCTCTYIALSLAMSCHAIAQHI